jgi:hypothetical protein
MTRPVNSAGTGLPGAASPKAALAGWAIVQASAALPAPITLRRVILLMGMPGLLDCRGGDLCATLPSGDRTLARSTLGDEDRFRCDHVSAGQELVKARCRARRIPHPLPLSQCAEVRGEPALTPTATSDGTQLYAQGEGERA